MSRSAGTVRNDERGAVVPDPQAAELREEPRDRVVELEPALLVERHQRHAGDRLGHRVDPEDRVGLDRTARRQVPVADAGQRRHLAPAGHQREHPRQAPRRHVGLLEEGPDAGQAARREPEVLRLVGHGDGRHAPIIPERERARGSASGTRRLPRTGPPGTGPRRCRSSRVEGTHSCGRDQMSLGQGLQRSAAFRSNADLDLDAFRALCEQEVDPGLVPNASAIVQRVPVYDATVLRAATAITRGPPGDDGRAQRLPARRPGRASPSRA